MGRALVRVMGMGLAAAAACTGAPAAFPGGQASSSGAAGASSSSGGSGGSSTVTPMVTRHVRPGRSSTVQMPGLVARQADLLLVYWTAGNNRYYPLEVGCAGPQGELTRSYEFSDGQLTVQDNYCNQGATGHVVLVHPAARRLSGTFDSPTATITVQVPEVDPGAMPLWNAYFSDDNGEHWYADSMLCSGPDAAAAGAGEIRLSRNYCVRATHWQVVLAAQDARLPAVELDGGTRGARDGRIRVDQLPLVQVYWKMDDNRWIPRNGFCSGSPAASLEDGILHMNGDYCTGGSTAAVAVVRF